MLKSKKFVAPMALLALGALGGGCGDDSDTDGGTGTTGGGGDGGTTGGGVEDVSYTTIPITDSDDSNKYTQPHTVFVLDTETLEPVPGLMESYTTKDGVLSVKGVPTDRQLTLWTVGNPDAMTYDSIGTSPRGAGEKFIYLSGTGTADLVAGAANFELKPDRAAVSGAVYYTPGGPGNPRMGTVACAQVFLDDATTGLDEATDQRYIQDVLPAEGITETYQKGAFYFANMTKGEHTLKVSLDGGKTFVEGSETDVNVTVSRAEAKGPTKNVIYTIGIDITSPTPADCTN